MAILVTGGAGFVGLNMVEVLLARGEEVVLFDRGAPPPAAERAWATQRGRLRLVAGNVLTAAREHQVGRVVYTGSGAVYGESFRRFGRIYEDSTPALPVTLDAHRSDQSTAQFAGDAMS